jgi:hypothetical protein
MIFHQYKNEIVNEYIFEGFRRLYANSVNKNGIIVNFDILYAKATKGDDNRLDIGYENYYSPPDLQTEILDKLVKEPYITPRGAIRYLKKHEQDSVRINTTLGCSPSSSKVRFSEKFDSFNKIKEEFD